MAAFHVGKGVGVPYSLFPNPTVALNPLDWQQKKFHFQNWHWKHWDDPALKGWYYPSIYSPGTLNLAGIETALRNSRQAWLFLNEPDMKGQANTTPWDAVKALTRVYMINPRLRWAGPNCCLDRDYAWEWMTEFVRFMREQSLAWVKDEDFQAVARAHGVALHDANGRPRDDILFPEVLGAHCYGLKHIDPHGPFIMQSFNIWWRRLKEWMYANGLERQVIVTETSAELPNRPDVDRYYMQKLDELIRSGTEPRLQGYLWFSARYRNFSEDLLTAANTLTAVGEAYVAL